MNTQIAVPRYLRSLEIQNRSPRTITEEKGRLKRFVTYLTAAGVGVLDELSRAVVRAYPEELACAFTAQGTPLKITTQTNLLIAARNFLRWLHREDLVPLDLSGQIILPRAERPLPKEVIELPEMRRLMDAPDLSTPLGLRDRAIFEVLYSTAVRVSELTALKTHDLDLGRGYVHVVCGKGAKDRVVPIGRQPSAMIERYLANARPLLDPDPSCKHLFVSAHGRPLPKQTIAERVRRYAKLAGIQKRITPHCFRVTCATGMLRNGAHVRYLQEMLGHQSVKTLGPYLRLTVTELKDIHDRFHPRERLDVEGAQAEPPTKAG